MSLLRRNMMIASASVGGVKNYLAFEALEDGTFTLTIPSGLTTTSITDVSYSVDGGSTWVTTQNVDNQEVVITTPTITAGNKVLWRGNAVKYANSSSVYSKFASTGQFNVSGNIMSLLYGNKFEGKLSLPSGTDTFVYLFTRCSKLISSEDLLLPATDIKVSCYAFMFNSCTSMTKTVKVLPAMALKMYCYQRMYNNCPALLEGPELPAETLVSYCYNYMFTNCSKLAYVKAMFLTEPSTSYTNIWLANVAASGTFVKNAAATWDVSGSSGIPTGWTVETASE